MSPAFIDKIKSIKKCYLKLFFKSTDSTMKYNKKNNIKDINICKTKNKSKNFISF